MRRELGEAVFCGTNPLILNREVVRTDLTDFETAIAADRHADAVRVYRGPFLDGFFLREADEFERWVDSERSQLAASYRTALDHHAQSEARRGNFTAAIESLRKLAALDPLDAAAALGLIKALASAGEDAAALAHARIHQRLLEDELGIGPNPMLTEFVAQLRGRRQPRKSEASSAPSMVVADDALPAEVPTRADRGWRGWRTVALAVLISAPLITGVIWAIRSAGDANRSEALGTDRIVVLPFRVGSADSSLMHLRKSMVYLVAQRLTGEGSPSAVDPVQSLRLSASLGTGNETIATEDAFRVARRAGAAEILLGDVVTASRGRVLLSAAIRSVLDPRSVIRASVEGSPDSLARLTDQLISDVLARRAGEPETRLSALRETKLPAVRAFLAGRAAHRRGDDAAAIAAFEGALAQDSTFALAGLELASAMGWLFRWTVRLDSTISGGVRLGSGVRMAGDEELWIRAIDLAWNERARLSRTDLAYLAALRGRHYPRAASAREVLADWETMVRIAPERAEVWTRLGQVLLQQGVALGRADAHDRAKALFADAGRMDPGYNKPVAFLLELAASAQDTAEVRRLAALYLSRDSTSADADFLRWRAAGALGDGNALASLRKRFDSLHPQTLERIQWSSQVNGIEIGDAERAMSILVMRAGERRERWIYLWRAILLALNTGRPGDALRITEAKRQVEPDSGLFRWYRLEHAMYAGGDSVAGVEAARLLERDALAALASGKSRSIARGPYEILFLVGQWRLWQGDTTGVVATIRGLRRDASDRAEPKFEQMADILEAILAAVLRRPDAPTLLERVDSIALQGCCDTPHYIGLVVARLRERAGDRAGALRALRRGRWFYPPEHLTTFLTEEGRVAALTGDRAGAIKAYKHYLVLQHNVEAQVQPQRESIRAELTRLQAQPVR